MGFLGWAVVLLLGWGVGDALLLRGKFVVVFFGVV